MSSSKASVWVIEFDFADGNGFVATVGTALTREDARIEKELHWDSQAIWPEKVRIAKYERVD